MELEGKTAVVTGASSGIGAATVRKLREAGVRVVGGARRVERIDADVALPLDVTDEESSAAFVEQRRRRARRYRHPLQQRRSRARALPVHGVEPRRTRRPSCTRTSTACCGSRGSRLPHIRDGGHILFTGSIAGRQAYQNAAVVRRREVRAARLRRTASARTSSGARSGSRRSTQGSRETEFSLVRFKGDAEKAKAPCTKASTRSSPDEVADCILFALTRPLHVNVDEIVIKALQQSSGGRIVRHGE